MALTEKELVDRAASRYSVMLIGGDAVFLQDRRLGHNLYMGSSKPLTRPELRRYVSALNQDLREFSTEEFFERYGLRD